MYQYINVLGGNNMKIISKILGMFVGLVIVFGLFSCDSNDCSHSYGSWSIQKESTCEEEGLKSRTCIKCGEVQTQTISPKGHNYSNGVCTICGKSE